MKRFFLLILFFVLTVSVHAQTLEKFLSEPYIPPVTTPVKGFNVYGGEWVLKDGVLTGPAGSGFRLTKKDLKTDSVVFSAEVFLEKGKRGNAALVTNCAREGIGADAFDGYEFALYADGQYVMLGRHEQNFRTLTTAKCAIPEDEWIQVKAVTRKTEAGNVLSFFVNGRKAAEVTDPTPLPAGSISLRPWQRTALYRNLALARGRNSFQFHLNRPRPPRPRLSPRRCARRTFRPFWS